MMTIVARDVYFIELLDVGARREFERALPQIQKIKDGYKRLKRR